MTCNVSMWDMAVINRAKVKWSIVLNTLNVREAGFQHASKVAGSLYADAEWLDVDTVYPRRLYILCYVMYVAETDGSKCQAPRFPIIANTRCKHSCIHATKLLPDTTSVNSDDDHGECDACWAFYSRHVIYRLYAIWTQLVSMAAVSTRQC